MNRLYALLATLAAPLLLHPRLRQGWQERLGLRAVPRCDLWIQAASAGECRLVEPLLAALPAPLRVLATATTDQGFDILNGLVPTASGHGIELVVRHQPWDHPAIIGRLLRQATPRAVVLLETELWPGFLFACQRQGIPVAVVSARMTRRSFARLLRLAPWLRPNAPQLVAAVSPADAARFATLFPAAKVQVVPSLKFALALDPMLDTPPSALARLVAACHPILVLGSVRAEEEPQVVQLIHALRHAAPTAGVLLFPRHLHRVAAWERHLKAAALPFRRRSQEIPLLPGEVLLADGFGELRAAYALAHRAFVGGTLVGGGHNFLEPLAQGVLPVIGPHWEHFAWVGEDLVQRLVTVASRPQAIAAALLEPAPPRAEVRTAFAQAIAERGHGAKSIAALLSPLVHPCRPAPVPQNRATP